MSEYANIPDELRNRNQWLYWNASSSTPRKPLATPAADHGASWSDPAEWVSFETAVEGAQSVATAGIGYVTAADNDDYARGLYGVLDLDGVVAEDGPGTKDWVPSLQPFFDRDAYMERSPSGEGIHIPVVGIDAPEWWADAHFSDDEHEGVEVLTNKFATFTGDQLRNSGDTVAEYGPWLDDWLRECYKQLYGESPLADADADADDLASGDADARDIDDEWLDRDVAEQALEHVSPDIAYPTWRDIGMALVNHLGQSAGGGLFKQWSRSGSKWDRDAEKQAERIIKDAGTYGYDAGTIVYYAQQHGWDASAAAREALDTPPTPDPSADGGAVAARAGNDDTGPDGGPPSWARLRERLRQAEEGDDRAGPRFDAAMKLNEEHHYVNLQENEVLYCYDEDTGLYIDNGKQVVRQELTEGFQEQYRGQTMSNVLDHIRGRNTVTQQCMGGPEGMVAATNCVIDLHEETTHDHSPEYMFRSRLGVAFDPDAECPQWRAFLDQVVGSDTERKKLQEFVGYCLHHWGLPYHKALFLVGPTASGKSTFLDTVRRLLDGPEDTADKTVSSLTPQQLTSERFAPAELYGKWANIRNDIPKATVKNTGMFKEVVGGDPMKAERKRKDPFFFEPAAKHMFSANQLPEMEVDDEAFFRRILLVPFPETVPKPERDQHLADKLEDELSGILNWAIEGLQRVLGRGAFTGDRSPAQTRETWSKWGDSVTRFASVALTDGDKDIPKAIIYAAYLQYCREESIPTDTQHMMTRQLKQEGYTDGRAMVDGSRERCFTSVAWTGRGQQLVEAAQGEADEDGSATGLGGFD